MCFCAALNSKRVLGVALLAACSGRPSDSLRAAWRGKATVLDGAALGSRRVTCSGARLERIAKAAARLHWKHWTSACSQLLALPRSAAAAALSAFPARFAHHGFKIRPWVHFFLWRAWQGVLKGRDYLSKLRLAHLKYLFICVPYICIDAGLPLCKIATRAKRFITQRSVQCKGADAPGTGHLRAAANAAATPKKTKARLLLACGAHVPSRHPALKETAVRSLRQYSLAGPRGSTDSATAQWEGPRLEDLERAQLQRTEPFAAVTRWH